MTRIFEIEGIKSSQLPLRVLNVFAQQDVMLERISIVCDDDVCRIRLEESSLDEGRAAVCLAKLQSMVLVTSAVLSGGTYKPPTFAPSNIGPGQG